MGTRGFIFTTEAMICLILAAGMSGSLFLLQYRTNLNDILLYQYAQDAAEVCAKKYDLAPQCVGDAVKKANPNLKVAADTQDCAGAKINRNYGQANFSFCVWVEK